MTKLSKYTLAFKGLSVGVHEFRFDADDAFFNSFEGSEIVKGSAKVDVEVTKQSNMLTLDFDITGEVMVECDRCLDDFMIPVDCQETLLIKFSTEEMEPEADVIWLNPSEQEVNLAQFIYECIALSLPYQRIHPDDKDGNTTCNPEMLEKFKIVTPEEFDEIVADKENENKSWEEQLTQLKDKMDSKK